ncbi:MAG: T9SS type A sorting domain-containing protein [Saprospiraceae bacterium]|nr:T9SS type A sorting domain-containing protein [Saprospiraceae bacterium]
MKFKVIYLGAIIGAIYIFIVGFSGGPTAGLGDKTGSPLSTLGGTCATCHSGGLFVPAASIIVSDAAGFPVANGMYTPGQTYTITLSVIAPPTQTIPPQVAQYGGQLTALTTSNVMAGSFSSPTTGIGGTGTGSQITLSSSVSYLEHNEKSTDGIFNVTWTAPPTGTGDVTIYAAGIAVNGTGSTSGDNVTTATATFIENTSVAVTDIHDEELSFNIYPNPITDGHFFVDEIEGEATIIIHHVLGGVVYQQTTNITGKQEIQLDVPKGIYTISVLQDNKLGTKRIVL